MHKIRRIIFTILFLCIPTLVWAESHEEHSGTVLVKHLNLQSSRIVGFRIEIKNAYIDSVSNMPRGWSVEIENNPMPYAVLVGNSIVGAAGINSEDLSKIRIHIKEDDEKYQKFSLDCKINVTKQFEEFKEMNITDRCIYTH